MAVLKYYDNGEWKTLTVIDVPADLAIDDTRNLHLIDGDGNKVGSGVTISTSEFSTQKVAVLPTENISASTIYLVPAENSETNDAYEEYVYVDNAWEKLGNLDSADDAITDNLGEESQIDDLFK